MAEAAEIELKRARACVYVKRAYEKKKNTLNNLRQELATLEHEYKVLLTTPTSPNQLLQRYNELAALKHQLYTENDALRTMVSDHMLVEARLQQVVNMYTTPPISELPFHLRPLTTEQIHRALEACQARILRLLQQSPRSSSGLEVFGWRDRRHIFGNTMAFEFEKRFVKTSTKHLADQTWALLADPIRCRSIYSASMNAMVYALQYIDTNTVLVYWRLRPESTPLLLKSIILMARLEIPDGYAIACYTIDKDAIGFDDNGLNVLMR